MARLRANFVRGVTTNAPLLDSDTTLESGTLTDLPVVGGGNIAVLVLDANGLAGDPEIVYVTAHATGATTATILRGQEGTTARQHEVGTDWIHAPTAADFPSTYGVKEIQDVRVDLGNGVEPASTVNWTQVDADMHLTFENALPGDVVEVTFNLSAEGATDRAITLFDVASKVGGSWVNSWSLDAPVVNEVYDTGWYVFYDKGYVVINGKVSRVLTSDDFDNDGTVTLELIYCTDTAALTAAAWITEPDYPATMQGKVFAPTNVVAHVPSWDVDNPAMWGPDLGYDYEFNRVSNDAPPGWQFVNKDATVYQEAYGAGKLTAPATDDYDFRLLVREVPTEETWSMVAKISALPQRGSSDDDQRFGLCLYNDSSGTFVTLEYYPHENSWYSIEWTNVNTFSGNILVSSVVIGNARNGTGYFRIDREAADDYSLWYSVDGVAWSEVASGLAIDTAIGAEPTHMGLCLNVGTPSFPMEMACHWFRVRPLGGTPEPGSFIPDEASRIGATSLSYTTGNITIDTGGAWVVTDETTLSLPARAGDQIEYSVSYLANNSGADFVGDFAVLDENGDVIRRFSNRDYGIGSLYASVGIWVGVSATAGIVAEPTDIIDGRITIALANRSSGARNIAIDAGSGYQFSLEACMRNLGPAR